MSKAITGNFMRPDGTPAAGASVIFLLSQDGTAADGSGQIGHYPIVATLDESGEIPTIGSVEGLLIEANDEILPAGTFYTVRVVDPQFGQIYFERLTIAGTSPINLNEIAPSLQP
jgi:hypothetical protein